ncbi:MAG: hypothetical protein KGV46_03205 [Pasteurella sp.]|nr:hypothetical protein [Pasteurella sp.]
MARRKNTVTNQGMVGDYTIMRDFMGTLQTQIKDLVQAKSDSYAAMAKMSDEGFKDKIFVDFFEKFKKNSDMIDALNDKLKESIKFYDKVAALNEKYLNEEFRK